MVLVTVAIVCLLVIVAIRSWTRRTAIPLTLVQEQAQISRLALTQHLDPISVPFALAKREIAYWSQPVKLQTLHANVNYIGGSSGISIRLARGIYAHSGSSSSKRVVTNAWGKDDSGLVYITNQRLVFVGALSSLEVNRLKLMGFDVYLDAIVLKRSNAKAICLLTTDPQSLSAILSRMLKDTLSKSMQDAVDALAPSSEQKPAAVRLHMELKGPNGQIRRALVEFHDALTKTIDSRKISMDALALMRIAAPTPSELDPSPILHKILERYRIAVAALGNQANQDASSPTERLNNFNLAIGIFLDSLYEITRDIRTAPFPAGYDQTRQALIAMCDRNVEAVRSWSKTVEQGIDNLGISTACEVDLSFEVDIASMMSAFHDDAQRAFSR